MNIRTLTLSAAALLLGTTTLVACGDKDGSDSGSTGDAGVDSGDADADLATAQALWTEIEDYDTWSQTADWTGVQASADGTHGPFVQIWLNTDAFGTVSGGAGGDMPDGAILVKEGYDAEDGEATAVTVMKKIDGFDGDNGDWFWAKYQTDGTIDLYGSVSGCTGCHSSGQDYVLSATW